MLNFFSKLKLNICKCFRGAKTECQNTGGYLIELKSNQIEQNLTNYLEEKYSKKFDFWLGLRDHTWEGYFYWEKDGSMVFSR